MPRTGTLRTWNDDRGFGFIAPADGGRELFVHISAFPRDGSRPTVGETLFFEVAAGKDGKPQAIQVRRQALGDPASYPRRQAKQQPRQPRKWPVVSALISALVVVSLVGYGYSAYQAASKRRALQGLSPEPVAGTQIESSDSAHRCDGRTHCSQMTSCAEATFFLNNCPRTQMDGNNDGTPCEQQWCTSPFAR